MFSVGIPELIIIFFIVGFPPRAVAGAVGNRLWNNGGSRRYRHLHYLR